MGYRLDRFQRGAENYKGFAYSDGDEERNTYSMQLGPPGMSHVHQTNSPKIEDWPSRYHLTVASIPVAPFQIRQQRVLELGCGMGAITRYLGETGQRLSP